MYVAKYCSSVVSLCAKSNGAAMHTKLLSWADNNSTYDNSLGATMDEEVEKESGWKRVGNPSCTNNNKKGKINSKVEINTEEDAPITQKLVKEMMQERGEVALDKEIDCKTNIKVEWKLQHEATKFNLCNALIIFMKKIQQVNGNAYFQSSVTNNINKQPYNILT
eukprot:15062197-Ditylum_brightwellii.AAC.1